MSNPTTPFGWQMPTATDLVTDLPADFEVFGQAVATSMGDLLGGTTGQVLSKTSGTDMDFTWVSAAPGDITGVTAGVGISGGGTSGDVTVTNSMATAITTAGDLIKGTGSGTFDRLGVGTTGQVLTVASGAPSWATPAAGGSLTLIATANPVDASGFSFSSIPSIYQNLIVIGNTTQSGGGAIYYGNYVTFNSDSGYNYNWGGSSGRPSGVFYWTGNNQPNIGQGIAQVCVIPSQTDGASGFASYPSYFSIQNYASSGKKNYQWSSCGIYGADRLTCWGNGNYTNSTAISSIQFIADGTNLLTGTIQLWGQK